jgi:ribokinase
MSVCVLGSINLDIVFRVASLPAPGETIKSLGVRQFPGGKGGNQAVASARLDVATRLIGAIGADEGGREVKTFLAQAGVDLMHLIERTREPTGRAFICVDATGENCIVVDSGANAVLAPEHLSPDALAGHRVFLAQLETPIGALAAFYSADSARTGVKILNAAPADLAAKALFPLIDILVVNETELQHYAGLAETPKGLADIEAAAKSLIARPGQSVVVTLGGAGVALITEAEASIIPGREVEVVDTTGAGDCFCGVLAASLSEGADLGDSLARANAAGAFSVNRRGAATSSPTRADLEAFLAS